MFEEDVGTTIRSFYKGLTTGKIKELLSYCKKDAIFEWSSITFKGKEEIRQWAKEFKQIFPKIRIIDIKLTVHEKQPIKVIHEFIIDVTMSNGRRGMLPAKGTYDLKDGIIQHVSITLSPGFMIFSNEEIARLGLYMQRAR